MTYYIFAGLIYACILAILLLVLVFGLRARRNVKHEKVTALAKGFTLILILVPACSASTTANGASGSLKAITKPYIGEYECVAARLGESDLLEKYEFIKITLLDDEKMEVSFKPISCIYNTVRAKAEAGEVSKTTLGADVFR